MQLVSAYLARRINLFRLGMIGARWRVEGVLGRDLDPHWLSVALTPVAADMLRGKLFVRHLDRLPHTPINGSAGLIGRSAGEPAEESIAPLPADREMGGREKRGLEARDLEMRDLEMQDIAAAGENYRQARIYQYYLRRLEMGMPCFADGECLDTEEKARSCYFRYVDLYRTLQQHGYREDSLDRISVAITASGDFVHLQGGTARLAAARMLKLPFLRAQIAAIDIEWALANAAPGGRLTHQSLLAAIDDLILVKRVTDTQTPMRAMENPTAELAVSAI